LLYLPHKDNLILSIITYSLGIYAILLVFFIKLFERQIRISYPDAVLVHILLNILSIVERQPRRWAELGFRRQLIPMLEDAAICIQHGFRRQCQSGDDTVDRWVQDITERQAAGLRELKKWVLTPKSDTRNQFIARIGASLSQITSGNWDAFEQREAEKISRLQWWRSHVIATLRALYQGGLPMVGLWAFQQTSLAFKGDYATYATAAVFLWAMWVFITTYDPFKPRHDFLSTGAE
jgi:hypothetical protein